jgi:sodium pump decarboxylase gamma subunit
LLEEVRELSELIRQGLWLSIVGLGLTFAALGVLIGAMTLLERIFRTRPLVPAERGIKETPVVSSLTRDTEDEEIVAAIAIALAHLRSLEISRTALGTALEEGRGSWWRTGQAQRYTTAGQGPGRSSLSIRIRPIAQGRE